MEKYGKSKKISGASQKRKKTGGTQRSGEALVLNLSLAKKEPWLASKERGMIPLMPPTCVARLTEDVKKDSERR